VRKFGKKNEEERDQGVHTFSTKNRDLNLKKKKRRYLPLEGGARKGEG